jgi:hypothetical protein
MRMARHQHSGDCAGTTTLKDALTQVGSASDWQSSCGMRAGHGYCWGQNASAQLGDGTLSSRSTPAPVAGPENWQSFDVGHGGACKIASGALWCWGRAEGPGLGTGVSPPAAVIFN